MFDSCSGALSEVRELRNHDGYGDKNVSSVQTISLTYFKCFTIFPSCICCTILAKCPLTRLIRKDLKLRERRKESLSFVYVALSSKPEILRITEKKCTKVRTAHEARSFFLLANNSTTSSPCRCRACFLH